MTLRSKIDEIRKINSELDWYDNILTQVYEDLEEITQELFEVDFENKDRLLVRLKCLTKQLESL